MNYFVKKAGTFDVQGPFTVQELNERVVSGELDAHWLASSHIGETLDQIRNAPECDWCWLAEIEGVAGVSLPAEPRPKPQERAGNIAAVIIVVGVLNLAVFVPSHAAARRASDFQGLPAEMAAIACLILSGLLYMAAMMCVGHSVKTKQGLGRSIIGMLAGGSALIGWFVIKLFGK